MVTPLNSVGVGTLIGDGVGTLVGDGDGTLVGGGVGKWYLGWGCMVLVPWLGGVWVPCLLRSLMA